MKKKLHLLPLMFILMGIFNPVLSQITVLDDFESWTGTAPNGWSVSVPTGITPTPDAHSGVKAVRIGMAGVGVSGLLSRTFRISSQPIQSLSIWYKCELFGTDEFTLGGPFVSDTINNCSGTIAGSLGIQPSSTMVYTQKTVSYTYSGSCQPNKVIFMDMRISGSSSTSSYVKIDDITVSSFAVGEKEISSSPSQLESIAPNPSRNNRTEIIYTISGYDHVSLEIMDLSGRLIRRLVNTHQNSGRYKALVEEHDLPVGVYFCVLNTNQARSVKKLIIQ